MFPNIDFHSRKKWRKNVLYRLLIPHIDKLSKYDRLLYVDTDTLFFKDFDFLFDLPFDFNYGMFYYRKHCELDICRELKRALNKAYIYVNEQCPSIEARYPFPYYNAGVLVINNHMIRENIERWDFALSEFNRIYNPDVFIHNDQMFLNMFFKFDEYRSNEWEVNVDSFTKNAVIGHFYGQSNPI